MKEIAKVAPTSELLPAVISAAITRSGTKLQPRWLMVKDLPAMGRKAIQALGGAVFVQFTDTPIERIQTMTTLTNSEADVRAMLGWLKANAVHDEVARMDFSQTIPGYSAEVHIWKAEGYSFLVMQDFAGTYIYAWPGGRPEKVGGSNNDLKRLPHGLMRAACFKFNVGGDQ
ncbi:MAG: hypothetical protein WCJ64_15240 [Rhodospirillaceae bacterium]